MLAVRTSCSDAKKRCIIPQNITLAIRSNEELDSVLADSLLVLTASMMSYGTMRFLFVSEQKASKARTYLTLGRPVCNA